MGSTRSILVLTCLCAACTACAQGFELENPLAKAAELDRARDGSESYFSEFGGFRSLQKTPKP